MEQKQTQVNTSSGRARYNPDVFSVINERQARQIILTPQGGASTDERWEKETAFLTADIARAIHPAQNSLVVDYGCGIGRLAKSLIQQTGCTVLGVDISVKMRQLALGYVQDERFSVISPCVFADLVGRGLKADSCYSVWVLQHCPQVHKDIAQIQNALKPESPVYILNNVRSAVPTDKGWINDGVNIRDLLETTFVLQHYASLPLECSVSDIVENTFIGEYRTRGV